MAARSNIEYQQTAQLDRATRLAGQSFGCDDAEAPILRSRNRPAVIWLVIAFAAAAGLSFLALR